MFNITLVLNGLHVHVCIHVIVKAPSCVYGKYSTRRCVERLVQYETKPSAVLIFRHTPSAVFLYAQKHRQCFKCFIVLPGCLAQNVYIE